MMRRLYHAAADGCAEVVSRMPALEPPFVRIGARLWSSRGIGRFYQSAAYRVAARMRAAGAPFRRMNVDGVPLVLDATEFTTLGLYFGGHIYESMTTAHLVARLKPGHVVVDVGANHGYFSILAAALVGREGHVACFEPNPAVFEQLATHVKLNGFESRVSLSQIALSDARDEAARFFVSQVRVNSGLSSLTPDASTLEAGGLSEAHTIAVKTDTFDNWFAASGLTHVDLLKIDVEGAEARVIAGMQSALAAGVIRELILETVWGSPAHEALCAQGYDGRPLDPVGGLCNVLYARPGAPA